MAPKKKTNPIRLSPEAKGAAKRRLSKDWKKAGENAEGDDLQPKQLNLQDVDTDTVSAAAAAVKKPNLPKPPKGAAAALAAKPSEAALAVSGLYAPSSSSRTLGAAAASLRAELEESSGLLPSEAKGKPWRLPQDDVDVDGEGVEEVPRPATQPVKREPPGTAGMGSVLGPHKHQFQSYLARQKAIGSDKFVEYSLATTTEQKRRFHQDALTEGKGGGAGRRER